MPRNWQWVIALCIAGLLAGCAGSTMPDGGIVPDDELDYEVTADAGSTVGGAQITGEQVSVAQALQAYGGALLPDGFTGVLGMHFTPETATGAGFSGMLNVRVAGDTTTSQADGDRLYLYYTAPNNSATQFVSSGVSDGGWVNFRVNMLGYFVIAENDAIPSGNAAFTAYAFADQVTLATGAAINCWAVAQNGYSPYTFLWSMGDGTELGGDQVTHSYATAGEYTINVLVTDAQSQTATAFSTPVTVTGGTSTPLSATVTVTPDAENPFLFTYTVNVTGGTAPYAYSWDFDGDTAEDSTTGPLTTFTFVNAGLYSGTLDVTDSASETAQVMFVADARTLSLAADIQIGIAPLTVTFTVYAAGFNVGDTITLDFGDSHTEDITYASGVPAYQTQHIFAAGTYSADATGISTAGGMNYSLTSAAVDIVAEAIPDTGFIQFTRPIVPDVGEGLHIYGFGFGATQGTRTVLLDTTPLTVVAWSDTVIDVDYPAGFSGDRGTLTVVDPTNGPSNPVVLTLNESTYPRGVQNMLPPHPEAGGRVLIIGHGFGDSALSLETDGIPATIEMWTNNAVVATLSTTLTAGTRTFVIEVPENTVSVDVTVVEPSTVPFPSLGSATPETVEIGNNGSMDLAGTNFSDGYGGLVFSGRQVLPVSSWDNEHVIVTDPSEPVDGPVVVINRDRCSNPLVIHFMYAPLITSVLPDYGAPGDTISIYGGYFGVSALAGDQVTLGGVPLLIDIWSDTQIDCTLPSGIADGDIIVDKALDSNAVPFDVVPQSPGGPTGDQL
ncbi:PKD domain-containing protein [bacterium]|nr:PKD domain-containing protein [bacterium]